MRPIILTSVLLASLAACEMPAEAANKVTGVPRYDSSTRTLWVNGRDAYYVPEPMGTAQLRDADRVTLTWEQQGDRRVVKTYSAEREQDNDR